MGGRTHTRHARGYALPATLRSFALVIGASALVVGMLLGISSAFAENAASPSPEGQVVLHVGSPVEPDTLNPFVAATLESYEIFHLNYDLLVGYAAKDMQPAPELAESWSSNADGSVWTFKLRRNVTWQDGEPFTADDVVFTFNYVIDNEMSAFLYYMNHVEEVVALDDYTVQIRASMPKADIFDLWIPILPEHIWSKVDPELANTNYQNEPPIIGTGPFQVVEWKRGSYVRLVANEDYWRGAPKIDEIIYETYKNTDTMVQELRSGNLDAAVGIPPAQFDALQSEEGIECIEFHWRGFQELAVNCYESADSLGNPVLRDVEFRRALQYAIDRDKLASVAWGGYAVPAYGPVPPGYYYPPTDYRWTPPDSQGYAFDLAKAGEILGAAGYEVGPDGARLDKRGKPIVLRLAANSDDPATMSAGKFISSWIEQLGIDIKYEVLDTATGYDRIWNTVDGRPAPDYDLIFQGWVGDYDPGWLFSMYTTMEIGSWSATYASNPEYDSKWKAQQVTMDPTARTELYWDMQQILFDEPPTIFLEHAWVLQAVNTADWEGWVRSPSETGAVWYTGDNMDTYIYVQPKGDGAEAGGTGNIAWIIVGVAAALVAGLALWLVRRRGKAVESR